MAPEEGKRRARGEARRTRAPASTLDDNLPDSAMEIRSLIDGTVDMQRPRTYSPETVEAASLLGARIRLARLERRLTLEELAERVGINHTTMRKVELAI